MYKNVFGNNKFKDDELISCGYSNGGGMQGGFSSVYIRKNNEGKITLETKEAATHSDRIVTKTYSKKKKNLNMIKDLIINYNMYKASKKKMSPYIAYDADTSNLSVSFSGGDYFNISSEQLLSEDESKHLYEIRDTLYSLAKGEAVIEVEPHEIALILDGYQLGYLMNESDGVEALLPELNKYRFEDYNNCAKATTISISLNTEGLPSSSHLSKGLLVYSPTSSQLLFLYDDYDGEEELYILGELEYLDDSAIELIKSMTDEEYSIYPRK